MNYDYVIISVNKDLEEIYNLDDITETGLYSEIKPKALRNCFAILHNRLNYLFAFMNKKSKSNGHFNAQESRELISLIETLEQLFESLKHSKFSFKINDNYREYINFSNEILSNSGGSSIPDSFLMFELEKFEPIFSLIGLSVKEKNVGEGSYAVVKKYTVPTLNIKVAIKKAKQNLNESELKRFKKEFEIMKNLSSPYIGEVYCFDDDKLEFHMEYIPLTLQKYIGENPDLTVFDRKKLVNQLFHVIDYIHRKGILHRDISLKNIMIKPYEDSSVILKIIDFGYLKDNGGNNTRIETVFAGSLNDIETLTEKGMSNYDVQDEIYALTRAVIYIMTGKITYRNLVGNAREFFDLGTNDDLNVRPNSVGKLRENFNAIKW